MQQKMMSSPFWNNILLSSLRLDAVKANARFEQIVGLEFLVTNIFEVFPAEGAAGIAQGILAVNAGACGFERIIVQILTRSDESYALHGVGDIVVRGA